MRPPLVKQSSLVIRAVLAVFVPLALAAGPGKPVCQYFTAEATFRNLPNDGLLDDGLGSYVGQVDARVFLLPPNLGGGDGDFVLGTDSLIENQTRIDRLGTLNFGANNASTSPMPSTPFKSDILLRADWVERVGTDPLFPSPYATTLNLWFKVGGVGYKLEYGQNGTDYACVSFTGTNAAGERQWTITPCSTGLAQSEATHGLQRKLHHAVLYLVGREQGSAAHLPLVGR